MSKISNAPRLLLIGHPYAALENRKKIQALAEHFDLVCVTSTLEDGIILGRPATDFDNESDAPTRRYELIRLPRTRRSFTTFCYAGLAKLMRSRQFDVVLIENEPWSAILWQARLLTGLFQRSAKFGEFTWENVERPSWKGMLLAQVYRAATSTTDFFIGGNQAAVRLLTKRGAKPDQVHVDAELGVDLSTHIPATDADRMALRHDFKLPADAWIVGYCGRMAEEKGIHELITVCEQRGDVHLALLGAGPMNGWLEEQAATRPWLHLLPPRPHWEIPAFLRCLNLFVLASKPVRSLRNCWEEQFGHVLIEAMACGVPTLGSDSGAIPEVIGMPEVIFHHGDVESLSTVLNRFRNDPVALAELAARQLERTSRLYTHEAVSARWSQFILSKLAA